MKKASNQSILIISVTVIVSMIGLAYASVPLYRLFCQVTGFGGTPQIGLNKNAKILDQTITVRFNADIDPELDWQFSPTETTKQVKIGETVLSFYKARNLSNVQTSGTAIYNVTPLKTGQFFNKIDCFCFEEQSLKPGEEVLMPVTFFIDPEIVKEKNLEDVKVITLSYTFYPLK